MARSKQRNPKWVTAAEKQIGERIALLRKIKGLSQGALGVEPQQVVLGEAEAADGCVGF